MPDAASTGAKRRLPSPKVPPKGRWGLWLAAQRNRRGTTQQEVFDELRSRWPDLFPWQSGTSLDSYRTFERGKEPTPDQAEAFLRFYDGAEPPADEPASAVRDGSADALIHALDAQTKALTALAAQVQRLVDREPTQTAAMTADLVALAIRETLEDVGLVARTPRP